MLAPRHTAPETFERGIPDVLRFINVENQFQTGDAQFFGKFNSGVNQTEVVRLVPIGSPAVERVEVLTGASVSQKRFHERILAEVIGLNYRAGTPIFLRNIPAE